MCVKAACKSEYSKYSKFGNIYESGKISSGVNLAQQESYVGEMYHNSASDGDSTGCFFGPLNSMHAVLWALDTFLTLLILNVEGIELGGKGW